MAREKMQKVSRLDRLNLSPQTFERQPMNPRQQTPIAPLARSCGL